MPLTKSPVYFNPRGPCGPRLASRHPKLHPSEFQSSRSLRTATRGYHMDAVWDLFQSSRSLRTATWRSRKGAAKVLTFQSSRSLRTATTLADFAVKQEGFQSSRSLRTATSKLGLDRFRPYISILAVLADRDGLSSFLLQRYQEISILAVLADRDKAPPTSFQTPLIFQSSRSLRTATDNRPSGRTSCGISILAVLADRDKTTLMV